MMLIFLILMIVTCCTSEQHLKFLSKLRRPETVPRTAETEKCVCYNISGPSAGDVLQNDQQRMVAYLYKDANNNLTVYIPSKDKQLLLPDFELGKGDVLTNVGTESTPVHQIFNPNNAVEFRRNNDNLDVPNLNLPNQLNSDPISSFNEDQTELPNSQYNDHSHLDEGIDVDVGIPNSEQVVNFDTTIPNSDIINRLLPVNLKLDKNYPPTNPADLEQQSFINPGTQVGLPSSLLPEDENPLPDKDEPLGEPSDPLSPFKASHLPYGFNERDVPAYYNTDLPNVDSTQNPRFIPLIDVEPGLPVDSSTDNPAVTNPEMDRVFENQAKPMSDPYSKADEYVTFDKWFDQQMQKINKTGQSPNKNFDLSSLKQHIEKNLYENEMYVTKDGVVIDSNGKALDVANLKLRPILIGDSVAYDSLFTAKDTDKYELPSNLPYLEAVLVTSVSPPKVLGVIPLGKTYVPRVSYRRSFDYFGSKASNCINGKCPKQPGNVASRCQSGKCPQLTYYKKWRRSKTKPTLSSVKKLAAKQAKLLSKGNKQTVPRVQKKRGRKGFDYKTKRIQSRHEHLNEFIKTLLYLDKLKKKNHHVVSSEFKGNNGYADVFKENSTEEEDDEDVVPWFRIIGGNAATSSGTPVSSRGRSANPIYLARHNMMS